MTANYSEEKSQGPALTDAQAGADIGIQLITRDGEPFIRVTRSGTSTDHAIEIPPALLPELKRAIEALEAARPTAGEPARWQTTQFAHPSEREFARILDFYHIDWLYEPRTFTLETDESGNPTVSFTPDFYLPDHDLFIELTTLKQSLVTKKNRKLRRLRELYPEVNIKMLYASDYRKLVEKFVASGRWHATAQEDVEQGA